MPTITEALETAVEHHQAGRLTEAENIYRQILRADPNEPNALYLLGTLAHQVGHPADAVTLLEKAATVLPENPEVHANMGKALADLGRGEEAVVALERALSLAPDHPDALFALGCQMQNKSRHGEAIEAFFKVLEARPEVVEAWNNLGVSQLETGAVKAARESFEKAIALAPNNAEAHTNLGNVLLRLADDSTSIVGFLYDVEIRQEVPADVAEMFEEARSHYVRALEINPLMAEALNNLGNVHLNMDELDDAIDCFNKAISANPAYSEAYTNLGNALIARKKYDEAIAAFQKAITFNSDMAEAHNNLGTAFVLADRVEDAIASLKRALEIDPDFAKAIHQLGRVHFDLGDTGKAKEYFTKAAFGLDNPNYFEIKRLITCEVSDPDATNATILKTAKAVASVAGINNDLPERDFSGRAHKKPRVAFHYSGFNTPAAEWGLVPLINNLDRNKFDVFTYGDCPPEGAVHDATIRDTLEVPDLEFADLVFDDEIDIMVDAEGSMPGYRFKVFWKRIAPVQACFFNYQSTSGLPTMDYYITDELFVPPSEDKYYCEKVIRIPPPYIPYIIDENLPELMPPPVLSNGHINFGYFGHLSKLNAPLLSSWGIIMDGVPGARLLMMGGAFRLEGQKKRMLERLGEAGIDPSRVELRESVSYQDYFKILRQMDMILDPYPFNGGHTIVDAIMTGVSMISHRGERYISRAGGAILENSGFPELIAESGEDYVEKYVSLANDHERLSYYRENLRKGIFNDAYMDAVKTARSYDEALASMWESYISP